MKTSGKRAKALGWRNHPSVDIVNETRAMASSWTPNTYYCAEGGDEMQSATTSNTGGDNNMVWIDTNQWGSTPIQYVYPQTIIQNIETKEVKKEMRSLYRVYVVDPRKNGKVLKDGELVIADNENQAMLKAGVATVAAQANLELEQVDVYVEKIGTFIRPRKETQRVKMVKEEE